jgi:hypothetical protein
MHKQCATGFVGVNLKNDGHVVRRAAFIHDVFHDELFAAEAGDQSFGM